MATGSGRREVTARCRALVDELRRRAQDPSTRPGDPVPTLRELRATYGLSSGSVTSCLRRLSDEGVLVTVPRVGAFYALAPSEQPPTFLFAVEDDPARSAPLRPTAARVRSGFEQRCAQLGGSSVVVGMSGLRDPGVRAGLMRPAGAFAWTEDDSPTPEWLPHKDVHQVRFTGRPVTVDHPPVDRVDMDQLGGGRVASEHLARQGHRRIAFLGLHTPARADDGTQWSSRRAAGCRQGLQDLVGSVDMPTYLPAVEPVRGQDELAAAREPARRLVDELDDTGVTAVVGANNEAVAALLAALDAAGLHHNRWPAIVGFDTGRDLGNDFVSSIQSPYEEMGRAAATLLWERHVGRRTGPGVERILPMTPIHRLSSRLSWRATLPGVELFAAGTGTAH